MTWLIIGLFVGAVMGLTGAGGAIIAIPLFIQLVGMNFKESIVVSLGAVFVSASLNWYLQRNSAKIFLAATISLSAIASANFFLNIKNSLPEFALKAIFLVVCSISFLGLFKGKNTAPGKSLSTFTQIFVGLILGIVLGGLNTLTGLGGGVLIVPLLLNFGGLNLPQAAATSLFATMISSPFVFFIQKQNLPAKIHVVGMLMLCAGIISAAFGMSLLIQKTPQKLMDPIRKLVLFLVILFAAIRVL